jgi:Uma2 family endonuclease
MTMQRVHFESETTPIRLPRAQLRFPITVSQPSGFRAERPATWPRLEGRLEFVGGEILFMPPCADFQQAVSSETIRLLGNWSVEHPEYLVAGNEAGMILGGEVRAADVAVWKRSVAGPHRGVFRRVAPVLVVELAGEDEEEAALRAKARWYLSHGVEVVWLAFPRERLVISVTDAGSKRVKGARSLPAGSLPGSEITARELFRQLR